jgi:hypothetical protein
MRSNRPLNGWLLSYAVRPGMAHLPRLRNSTIPDLLVLKCHLVRCSMGHPEGNSRRQYVVLLCAQRTVFQRIAVHKLAGRQSSVGLSALGQKQVQTATFCAVISLAPLCARAPGMPPKRTSLHLFDLVHFRKKALQNCYCQQELQMQLMQVQLQHISATNKYCFRHNLTIWRIWDPSVFRMMTQDDRCVLVLFTQDSLCTCLFCGILPRSKCAFGLGV